MAYPTISLPALKLKIKGTINDSGPSIIFWGTPEFAAIILKELINNQFPPRAVVTSPDKAVGRKQILTPSPVKQLALEHNIPVLQPANLQTYQLINLQTFQPDLFIVAAYGLILPKEILDIPKFGSLNIHPSLLPKYRGASPIQAVILNGDQETGVTIILMDEKVDHGPIVQNKKLNISPRPFSGKAGQENKKYNYLELSNELAKIGADLLIEILPRWLRNEIKPIPQDHSQATFTKIIKKEDGQINWQNSAEYIERMIRAYNPWPGTYTKMQNAKCKMQNDKSKCKILKILKAAVLKIDHRKTPGTVSLTENKQLAVACGQNALILEEVQPEGKKQMSAQEFLNGHPEIVGTVLF